MEEKKGSDPEGVKNRKIVIGICTFLRNHSLDNTLESLSRIDLPDGVKIELLLVDNDKNGGAREVFDYHRDILPFDSHYVIEPRQGLACARNRVIEESLRLGATEIACIDDDEIASQQWLTALWNVYKDSEYSGAGGPVYQLVPPGTNKILADFWSRYFKFPSKEYYIIYFNNSIFSTDLVRSDRMNLRFDEFFNEIGGEDVMFSIAAVQQGARFVYAPEAIVIEKFPKTRATFRSLLKRRFCESSIPAICLSRITPSGQFSKCSRMALFGKVILPRMVIVPLRAIYIPFSIFFGKRSFWENILRLVEAAGEVVGYFGKLCKRYTKKNIAAESSGG